MEILPLAVPALVFLRTPRGVGGLPTDSGQKDARSARGVLRGLPYWNFDLSLAKRTEVMDRIALLFSADFLNAFNHVVFNDPTLGMQDPASFGVISSQANNPRAIQFGLRLEF